MQQCYSVEKMKKGEKMDLNKENIKKTYTKNKSDNQVMCPLFGFKKIDKDGV